MAKTIVFSNHKGGVGKTSICAGVAGCLSALGKNVLAIDLDMQGNLSFMLGADNDSGYNIYHAMTGKVELYNTVRHLDICDGITADRRLATLDAKMNEIGSERILLDGLAPFSYEYDYILIDTPPSLSSLLINAFTASDWVVIPMLPEILSIQGINKLEEFYNGVKKNYNKRLEVRGIVLNKYNPRLTLTREVESLAEHVADRLGTEVFKTKITQSIAIAESPAHAKTIYEYAPKSKPAAELMQLTYEIIGASNLFPKRSAVEKRRSKKN